MKNTATNEVMALIGTLSTEERKALVDRILNMMNDPDNKPSCNELVLEKKNGVKPDCPHCGGAAAAGNIIKRGYNRNGSQRFYCKACGRLFVPTTGTAFAYTHKDADLWRKFIALTIEGATLAVCARECRIAYQTAFTWRHKVLNVFRAAQEDITMTGWVEADELLIPLSYKGNHIKGRVGERRTRGEGVDTRMPREAYKRGTDNKVRSSKERACVFCMVENANQSFYAAVPGIGYMNENMLNATIGKRVDRSSAIMLVDQYRTTLNYLNDNNYQSVALASNTSDNPHEHKPEVRGENREIHLQHVNAMHTYLRKFIKDYRGVSSKYLGNYVAMYTWLKNSNNLRNRRNASGDAEARAVRGDCYITQREIESMPMVPTVQTACA